MQVCLTTVCGYSHTNYHFGPMPVEFVQRYPAQLSHERARNPGNGHRNLFRKSNAMTAKQGTRSKASESSNKRTNTTTSVNEEIPDALQLLRSDHAEVKELFDRFEKLGEDGPREEKGDIARETCAKLTVHATVEEEIFYPAAREVPDADALLNEAEVEHGTAKELITKIDEMDADDTMFDANFTVLSEYIKHHVKEEEGELFPKIQKSELDLDALGEQMRERKDALMAELELP